MTISKKGWQAYVDKLSQINAEAGKAVERYINKYGIENEDKLINYIYDVIDKYGSASSSLAAEMYNAIVELEGLNLPAATLAEGSTYEEVEGAIKDVLRMSQNVNMISNTASRLVKREGQDTMLKNAIRDHAEFAWIPHGDTCAFCITLASNGWRTASKEALKGGHAEHIHANCDCSYAIRHSKDTKYDSYNPDKYLEMYEAAEGRSSKDKINYMRRQQYAENKDKINAQKREAYRLRQEAKNKEE